MVVVMVVVVVIGFSGEVVGPQDIVLAEFIADVRVGTWWGVGVRAEKAFGGSRFLGAVPSGVGYVHVTVRVGSGGKGLKVRGGECESVRGHK